MYYTKVSDDGFLMIFQRFATTFWRFFKIVPKARRITFFENFRKFPKTFEEDPKMFRLYTKEFKYNLRDKFDSSEIIDIFTCEDIVSFLSIMCYHSVYHWLLYNKNISHSAGITVEYQVSLNSIFSPHLVHCSSRQMDVELSLWDIQLQRWMLVECVQFPICWI